MFTSFTCFDPPCAPRPVQSVSLLRAKLAHCHDALVVQARDGRRMLGVADRYESGSYFEVLGTSSTPGHLFAISQGLNSHRWTGVLLAILASKP